MTHRTPNQTSLGKQEMRIRANIELVERAGLTQLTRAFEKTRSTEVEPALEHTMINKSHGTTNVKYAKKFEKRRKRETPRTLPERSPNEKMIPRTKIVEKV